MTHITVDEIERYAMGKTPESDGVRLEEHLLLCQTCMAKLQVADRFVAAMRGAAKQVRQNESGPKKLRTPSAEIPLPATHRH
jgi:hypothetical protein